MFRVVLFEMRPIQTTDAHQTDRFAELVCSNSLKSDNPPSASWLLKQELRRLDSLLMRAAEKSRVPGGQALTVEAEMPARVEAIADPRYLTMIVQNLF